MTHTHNSHNQSLRDTTAVNGGFCTVGLLTECAHHFPGWQSFPPIGLLRKTHCKVPTIDLSDTFNTRVEAVYGATWLEVAYRAGPVFAGVVGGDARGAALAGHAGAVGGRWRRSRAGRRG